VNFLLTETVKKDCEPSFAPIVASAEGGVEPHHEPEKRIKKGFLVIDFGVRKDLYCSDITRTIYIGRPSKKEMQIYERVLKTQKNAVSKVSEGKSC